MSTDVYLQQAAAAMPRLLSWIDRDLTSPTAGASDRLWWAWKFSDIHAPRMQEVALALALARRVQDARFQAYRNPLTALWIDRILRFATTMQHADGTFDEAYPYERSLGATAFLSAAMARTMMLCRDDLPSSTRERVGQCLGRAADALIRQRERHGLLGNHRAAAVDAVLTIGRLMESRALRTAGARMAEALWSEVRTEGWLPEYDGADPGYQTHALGYLLRVAEELRWTLDRFDPMLHFLAHFVGHDDGFGGEVGSRRTAFCFPGGIEQLAVTRPTARGLVLAIRRGLAHGSVVGLQHVDDRNLVPMLTSYLDAATVARPHPTPPPLPRDTPGSRWFPRAGIATHTTHRYHAIYATRLGGVLLATGRDGTAFVDGGWGNRHLTTALPVPLDQHSPPADEPIVSAFRRRAHITPSLAKHAALRIAGLASAALPAVSVPLKRALVWGLVTRRSHARGRLTRAVRFTATTIEVDDIVEHAPTDVHPVARISALHMGSSNYFQLRELAPSPRIEAIPYDASPTRRRIVAHFDAPVSAHPGRVDASRR